MERPLEADAAVFIPPPLGTSLTAAAPETPRPAWQLAAAPALPPELSLSLPNPRLLPPCAPPPGVLRRAQSQPSENDLGEPRTAADGRRRKRRQKTPEAEQPGLALAVGLLSGRVEAIGRRLEADAARAAARDQSVLGALRALPYTAPPAPAGGPAAWAEGFDEACGSEAQLLQMLGRLNAHFEQLQEHQSRRADDQARLLEEKVSKTEVLRELLSAVRALSSPLSRPLSAGSAVQRRPRYRAYMGSNGQVCEFPEVAIATKLYQVSNVDTAALSFEVDFVVRLEWRDDNLEGIPCEEFKSLDWAQYFNPHLEIDNDKDNCSWIEGMDTIPRRRRRLLSQPLASQCSEDTTAAPPRLLGADELREEPLGCRGPWLRKTMRFRGRLAIAAVDLQCFPFDIQALPIRLRAGRSRSTALATPAATLLQRDHRGRVHLVDHRGMQEDPNYLQVEPRLRGEGHYAIPAAGRSLLEYRIRGITGYHPEPGRGDCYEVGVFVERPLFASHFWDLVIMNLLVLLASTSFWDSVSPELSSRMSISLTIILTLAAYTSTRPAAIEKAPYVTFHDWCEQMGIVIVTGISVHNVFAVVMCGGEHGEAPVWMAEEFERNEDSCGIGWCMSRGIDCNGLLIMVAGWMLLVVYSLAWLARSRCRATSALDQRLVGRRSLRAAAARGATPCRLLIWPPAACCRRKQRQDHARPREDTAAAATPAPPPPAAPSPWAVRQPVTPQGRPWRLPSPARGSLSSSSDGEGGAPPAGHAEAFSRSPRGSLPHRPHATRPQPLTIDSGGAPAGAPGAGDGALGSPFAAAAAGAPATVRAATGWEAISPQGPLHCRDVSSPSSAGDRSPPGRLAAAGARHCYRRFLDSPSAPSP